MALASSIVQQLSVVKIKKCAKSFNISLSAPDRNLFLLVTLSLETDKETFSSLFFIFCRACRRIVS